MHYSTNVESTALASHPDQGGEEGGVGGGPSDGPHSGRVTADSLHLEIVTSRTNWSSHINLSRV